MHQGVESPVCGTYPRLPRNDVVSANRVSVLSAGGSAPALTLKALKRITS